MGENPALRIRHAGPTDTPAVTAFNLACVAESENLALDPARVRAGVETVLRDPARGRYYLAEDARGPAGQVMVTYEWSDWRNAWVWWLQSVYVRADARRGGLFTALLRYVENEARHAGVPLIRLYVERDNAAAERAYRGNGFEPAPYRLLQKTLAPHA